MPPEDFATRALSTPIDLKLCEKMENHISFALAHVVLSFTHRRRVMKIGKLGSRRVIITLHSESVGTIRDW